MSDQPDQDEQFRDTLDRLDSKAESLKANVNDANEKIGYLAESVGTFTKAQEEILNRHSAQDDVRPTIEGGKKMADAIEQQIDDIQVRINRLSYRIDSAMPTFVATSETSVTAVNSFAPETNILQFAPQLAPYPFGSNSDMKFYARKLTELDPDLAETYQGAWSAYYTQHHDPGRAALWQMRQVFDHLFDKLAPDDMVRGSEFWSPKIDGNPNAVHREERLYFAAHRCISDEARRTAMLESAKEMLRSYSRFQQAHERRALSPEKARAAFNAGDDIVRRWIDAADRWPPK